MTESFTLVFKGDLLQIRHDPLTTETPFGMPYSYGLGDFIVRHDAKRRALRLAQQFIDPDSDPPRYTNREMADVIRKALVEVQS